MSTTLSIVLKRASKIYHEGETIAGVVVVEGPSETRHEGLSLVLEGGVSLHFSAKTTGLLDAFSNNVKSLGASVLSTLPKLMPFGAEADDEEQAGIAPTSLVHTTVELAAAGRLPAGRVEIPFEAPLAGRGPPLLETYHGVFVNIMYSLKAAMKRSLFNKPLNTSCQFFVQYRPQEAPAAKPVRCEITPASIRASAAAARRMPHFCIYAELDSTVCALDRPVTGLIRVDASAAAIKSIEAQLVRVESCGAPAAARDGTLIDDSFALTTEIQNIQVGCGDVVRGRPLPLHMVLPRLFTAPTTAAPHFKIEFELNIAVIFEDDYLVTENFPILLLRCK